MGEEDKKAKFMRIFANIPDKLRGEDVIAVVDDKPFTWNAAAIEIKNDTDLGKKILGMLERVGIL
jgi:hypothetical protein